MGPLDPAARGQGRPRGRAISDALLRKRARLAVVTQLPDTIRRCAEQLFWDVDPNTLNLNAHRDFIIGRVLTHGNESTVRVLAETFGSDVLRDFVQRAPHRLDRRSQRFFEVVLSLGEPSCTTMPSRLSSKPLFVP